MPDPSRKVKSRVKTAKKIKMKKNKKLQKNSLKAKKKGNKTAVKKAGKKTVKHSSTGASHESSENHSFESKIKCKPHKKCIQVGGKCQNKTCKTKVVAGKCKGKSCVCCLSPCALKPKKKCKIYKGVCKKKCGSTERKIAKGCSNKKCVCCAKACKPLSACNVLGGYCVSSKKLCTGLINKKGCKGTKCLCCYPRVTTSVSYTTTTAAPSTTTAVNTTTRVSTTTAPSTTTAVNTTTRVSTTTVASTTTVVTTTSVVVTTTPVNVTALIANLIRQLNNLVTTLNSTLSAVTTLQTLQTQLTTLLNTINAILGGLGRRRRSISQDITWLRAIIDNTATALTNGDFTTVNSQLSLLNMAQTRLFHISCKINSSSSVNSQLLSDVQSVLASVNKAVGAGNVQTNNLKSRINTLQTQLNQLGGPIIPLPIVQPVPPLAICPVKLPPRPPNRIHTTTRPNTHEIIRTTTRNIILDDLYSQFRRLYSVLKAIDKVIMALTQVEALLKNLAAAIDVSITGHMRQHIPSEIIHGIQALIKDARNAITTGNTSILSSVLYQLNAARNTLILIIQLIVNRSLIPDRDLQLAVHSSLKTIEDAIANANAIRETIFREITDLQRNIFDHGGTSVIIPSVPPFVTFPTLPIFSSIASITTPPPSIATTAAIITITGAFITTTSVSPTITAVSPTITAASTTITAASTTTTAVSTATTAVSTTTIAASTTTTAASTTTTAASTTTTAASTTTTAASTTTTAAVTTTIAASIVTTASSIVTSGNTAASITGLLAQLTLLQSALATINNSIVNLQTLLPQLNTLIAAIVAAIGRRRRKRSVPADLKGLQTLATQVLLAISQNDFGTLSSLNGQMIMAMPNVSVVTKSIIDKQYTPDATFLSTMVGTFTAFNTAVDAAKSVATSLVNNINAVQRSIGQQGGTTVTIPTIPPIFFNTQSLGPTQIPLTTIPIQSTMGPSPGTSPGPTIAGGSTPTTTGGSTPTTTGGSTPTTTGGSTPTTTGGSTPTTTGGSTPTTTGGSTPTTTGGSTPTTTGGSTPTTTGGSTPTTTGGSTPTTTGGSTPTTTDGSTSSSTPAG
ncbi:mucin-2-like [Procambarus clarkii]|uniref:mucin-2-like n=1 Tax=Procambarus clarkii TaxID=6728 RepID=UPI0037446B35